MSTTSIEWTRGADGSAGQTWTWFVNSMSDLFHEGVPFEYVDRVFAVMALTPQNTYQILTKRPDLMQGYLATDVHARSQGAAIKAGWMTAGPAFCYRAWPWPLLNVWLGTSVEDQKRADERIPHLLKCPAAVRFLSCEPLLSQIDVHRYLPEIGWVIDGGESGGGAREYDVSWSRFLQSQCRKSAVPYFRKQLGANVIDRDTTSAGEFPDEMCWPHGTKTDCHHILLKDSKGGDMDEWPEDLRIRQMPNVEAPCKP